MLFTHKLISILLDAAETHGRQDLAFRGHANDKNSNLKQIILLISRYFQY